MVSDGTAGETILAARTQKPQRNENLPADSVAEGKCMSWDNLFLGKLNK